MICHFGCRGQYKGSDILRLAVLKYAAVLGAPYVDVEYLAAEFFFASELLLSPTAYELLSALFCLVASSVVGSAQADRQ